MQQKLKRRPFGRTGLMVTELGFGAMNLRMLGSHEEARALVHHVLDQGVNLIDTARAYKGEIAPGVLLESEKIVGEVLRARPAPSEPLVIITKGHAYTIPEFERDLATSLETLGVTGKGDDMKIGDTPIRLVYLIHGISTERWAEAVSSGVLDRLQSAKREGVVHFLGFSSHYPFAKEIQEAIDTGVFDVTELPYNVFNRVLGEDGALDLLRYAHEHGMGVINMKAFDGNGMVPIWKNIQELVSFDYPAMLRFCLSNPYISTVDAGARYTAEYDLDVATALRPDVMTPAERDALKTEAGKIAGEMHNICRSCMHCTEKFECPQGVDFAHILSAFARYTVLDRLGKDTSGYAAQYEEFEIDAEACIECGACLPWCEYRIDIPGLLKQAHAAAKG